MVDIFETGSNRRRARRCPKSARNTNCTNGNRFDNPRARWPRVAGKTSKGENIQKGRRTSVKHGKAQRAGARRCFVTCCLAATCGGPTTSKRLGRARSERRGDRLRLGKCERRLGLTGCRGNGGDNEHGQEEARHRCVIQFSPWQRHGAVNFIHTHRLDTHSSGPGRTH